MTASEADDKTVKQPTWHPHYNDETADIIFVSDDKVKFGVSLKLLAKSSIVFAGMVDLPTSSTDQDKGGRSIELGFDEKTVLAFIELVSVHNFQHLISPLNYDACQLLMELVDQFDCPRLQAPLRQQLYTCAAQTGQSSWHLFCFAADRNDWPMAREGLKGVHDIQVAQLLSTNTFPVLLQRFRPDWQLALSSVLLAGCYDTGRPITNWATLAGGFYDPTSSIDKEKASKEGHAGWIHPGRPIGQEVTSPPKIRPAHGFMRPRM